MANYADKATDLKLAQMEKKIARIYKDASNGLQKEANDYFASFASRYEKEYDAYLQGKYTDAQFKSWYYAQVGRGERWQVLKTDMAKRMTQANQIAAAYINDNTPGIYTLNANFAAYEIEGATGIAFNLVNEQAVRRLVEGKNHTEFRTLSVNPKRDYNWNTQKIQDALLSGILQGNSITKLTDKFMEVMGTNKNAAIRNCRTAVTSAQNGGRQSTFKRAQAMGIYLQKEWIATNDSRTRDSHRELDGVRVENDEPFPNGCMYPADPGGEPAEVYNCRCTMRAILPKYNGARRTTAINEGKNTKESYAKWLADKLGKTAENVKEAFTFEPAKDILEVKQRMADALGLDIDKVTLGRMNIDLANEYLDGVETFTHEFPEIKGLYTGFGTKTGGTGVMGVNKISGTGRYAGGKFWLDCDFELAFKNPKNVKEMRDLYDYAVKTHQSYADGIMGPKTTAIHELSHGLDHAIMMRENGYFVDGVLQTTIDRFDWNKWTQTVSSGLVRDTKMEVFGKVSGKEVADGTSYLGSYSRTNDKEMLAEAIAYELSGHGTNTYSATMLKKLREKVKEAFK